MEDITHWITQPRFDEYLSAANNDPVAARGLYEWNVEASGAFFELLSHVEVSLRNAVDGVMRPLETPESARIDVRRGWWFASGAFMSDLELKFYDAARKHLGDRADAAPRDKLLASMTFGMWVSIFRPEYEHLFRKHLVYAFPYRGSGFKRETVYKCVLALRNLRNRIAHHQAIFDLPLEERLEQALELLGWIDPHLREWVGSSCRVAEVLDQRPDAADSVAVIVPAKKAWPLYLDYGAYVCQPGRYFRQVSHIGFYADQAIQPEIAKVVARIDHVRWTPEEIGRRMNTGIAQDTRLAVLIRETRKLGWDGDEYQVFFLTSPENNAGDTGHVTLDGALPNRRKGRGSAWVRRQRYATVDDLRAARTVGDLDQD